MNPRSSCPEPEHLELFLKGGLDKISAEDLRLHLATCGLCSLLSQRLAEFRAVVESPEVPASTDWDRLQPLIDERFDQELRAALPALSPVRLNLRFWLGRPAIAWCFTLLLAYPAWLGLTRPAAISTPPPSVPLRAFSAQFLDLSAARDGPTAAAAGFTLRPGSPIVLGFFAAIQPGRSYTVSLATGSGDAIFLNVPAVPNDDLGNFFVECDGSLLRPGAYLLTVASKDPLIPPRQFEFTVR